ncbi:protein translocase subunit SecF [Candidatus Woesearchaeota archaeon]|nr:protein translocase subunit SecF [Candidatus Woesearchaeota archaeon]
MDEGNETSNIQEEGNELEGNQQAAAELQGKENKFPIGQEEGNDEPPLIDTESAENQPDRKAAESLPGGKESESQSVRKGDGASNEPSREKQETIREAVRQKAKFTPFVPRRSLKESTKHFFDVNYKKLLFIPLILTLLAIAQIGYQAASTGDFLNKDVTLKGGLTFTLYSKGDIDPASLEKALESSFPGQDIATNTLRAGTLKSAIIIADIDGTDKGKLGSFMAVIENFVGYKLAQEDYSIEIIGSSLGSSFFRELLTSLIIAFALMTLVVLIYYRSIIPSMTVISCVFSDIIVTLAAVNLLGIKLSTAGIAAFLMLTGYSVDTDMLLSTRMMKRKEGTLFERSYDAFKTGMTMSLTTMAAVLVGYFVAESETMKQIFLIIFIGMIADSIFTWIQNVGILRWHMEKKAKKVSYGR